MGDERMPDAETFIQEISSCGYYAASAEVIPRMNAFGIHYKKVNFQSLVLNQVDYLIQLYGEGKDTCIMEIDLGLADRIERMSYGSRLLHTFCTSLEICYREFSIFLNIKEWASDGAGNTSAHSKQFVNLTAERPGSLMRSNCAPSL